MCSWCQCAAYPSAGVDSLSQCLLGLAPNAVANTLFSLAKRLKHSSRATRTVKLDIPDTDSGALFLCLPRSLSPWVLPCEVSRGLAKEIRAKEWLALPRVETSSSLVATVLPLSTTLPPTPATHLLSTGLLTQAVPQTRYLFAVMTGITCNFSRKRCEITSWGVSGPLSLGSQSSEPESSLSSLNSKERDTVRHVHIERCILQKATQYD